MAIQDLNAVDDVTDAAAAFKTPDERRIDDAIDHRRELLKYLFTIHGTGLTNTEKLDVLHELTNADDRANPTNGRDRLRALADRTPGRGVAEAYRHGADLLNGLAASLRRIG